MKIVHNLNEDVWRSFVESQATGNIFHTPEMFQVFQQANGYQPVLWAVVDDSHCPFALFLPVRVSIINGPLHRFTTRDIVYGSMLCVTGNKGKQALRGVLYAYQNEVKGKALFTELRNLSDLRDIQPVFIENGFVFEEHLNYLINLERPAPEILQSFGRRTRKQIRKAIRDNLVQIEEITDQKDLHDWYRTLRQSYACARVPIADISLFEAAFKVLYPKGMAKFLVARVNGVVAACSVELPYKDTIYGWYGGCDRNYSNYYPNEVLNWYVMEWGANNGYRIYDFGGAGRPDEDYGPRKFKAKFGGDLVNYGRNNWIHSRFLYHFSKFGYEVFRRFFLYGPN